LGGSVVVAVVVVVVAVVIFCFWRTVVGIFTTRRSLLSGTFFYGTRLFNVGFPVSKRFNVFFLAGCLPFISPNKACQNLARLLGCQYIFVLLGWVLAERS